MTPEEKKPLSPPPIVAAVTGVSPADDAWNDEDGGDRPTRSVPAILLAALHDRPPSHPPPPVTTVPTNGTERMLITDAMLGRAPKLSTRTVKLPNRPKK